MSLSLLDTWDAYRLRCISVASSDAPAEFALLRKDELEGRLGIIEEHLMTRESITRQLKQAILKTGSRQRHTLCADEAEERRYMEEDAAFLPWRLFVDFSFQQAQELLCQQEREARQRCFQAYQAAFRTRLFVDFEELHRLRATADALDSLALKACHVGQTGFREGQLARTAAPEYRTLDERSTEGALTSSPSLRTEIRSGTRTARDAAQLSCCIAEEREARRLLAAARCKLLTETTLVQAVVEKRQLYNSSSSTLHKDVLRCFYGCTTSAQTLFEASAVRIQAAFRGHQVRAAALFM